MDGGRGKGVDRRDSEQRLELSAGRTEEIFGAFIRIAGGDFSVRLERTYAKDAEDTLVYFVNLLGEELDRKMRELADEQARLSSGVAILNEVMLQVAAGDLGSRVPRNESGDPIDVLSFLFNSTVEELQALIEQEQQQRAQFQALFDAMSDGVILIAKMRSNAEAIPDTVAPPTP